MDSIYQTRLADYGHGWYRAWVGFAFFVGMLSALHWLNQKPDPMAQVVCSQAEESRYRAAVEEGGLIWTADLDAALLCAHANRRRVFLAFHAMTDANCLINEHTVFRDSRVQLAMRRYVLVKLQIDVVPERYYVKATAREQQWKDGEANGAFLIEKFKTHQEPLYLVLQPTANGSFRVVREYDEAMINNQNSFLRFLEDSSTRPLADGIDGRGPLLWGP